MGLRYVRFAIVAALVLVGGSVAAHHATQAEFDKAKPFTIVGVMKRIQWVNPHVRWYLDVKDEKGTVTTWMITGSGPGAYRNNGITAAGVFPIGETYHALVAPARDGSSNAYIMTWTLPNGTKMDFWHDYGLE
jgi:hypothetical protein